MFAWKACAPRRWTRVGWSVNAVGAALAMMFLFSPHLQARSAAAPPAFSTQNADGEREPASPSEDGPFLPRSLTPEEERYLESHPFGSFPTALIAPTGPVRCPAEYEPMQGLLMSWEGNDSWKLMLAQMAARITTDGGGEVYFMCDDATDRDSAIAKLTEQGVDLNHAFFYLVSTDSIWIRDYGPRYIYEGNCRAIVDHNYNRPRPRDDRQPFFWSAARNHALYSIPLTHGGGNFHLEAPGHSFVTRLVVYENTDKTEQEIHDLWQLFQNVDTTFFDPLDRTVDSTQHIDMWMQVIADDAIVISDWPFNEGSQQDRICDGAAQALSDRGYRIFRVPARRVNNVHYTYTNVVMCNRQVFIPSYTNNQVQQHNAEALAVYEAALPDHVIIPLNSEAIVSAAGVMHCIVMHMPAPLGGKRPTVYLKNLRGGEILHAGDSLDITWISDDDEAVTDVDILLSTDSGQSFDTTIVSATEPDGLYTWTVPSRSTQQARLRLVVHDADDRTGADESDSDLVILDCGEPGDCPCAGTERIRKTRCRAPAGLAKLTVTLTGGFPGDAFSVELSTGDVVTGTVNDLGKGKARFPNVSLGQGVAYAEWGCGAADEEAYHCP